MKHKKALLIGCSFVISMGAAYFIGQNVVVPLSEQKKEQNMEVTDNTEHTEAGTVDETIGSEGADNVVLFNFVDNMESLEYQNKEETSDNPWGSTISKIEDETVGTSIVMMPNTYMSANYHVTGSEKVIWRYNIHPWMAEATDGLTMHVRVYVNGNEEPTFSQDYDVAPTTEYQTAELSLAEVRGQDVKITFSVGNGANNNSDGDWLVLNQLRIESVAEQNTTSAGDAEAQNNSTIPSDSVLSEPVEYISFTDSFDDLQFENRADNSDNPWGSTINNMLTEQDEQAIVMMPYTAIQCSFYTSGNEVFQWSDSIHPWVADVSDGMPMQIRVYKDGEKEPTLTQDYTISAEKTARTLDLSQFKGERIVLEIAAEEAEGADTSGDWLFLEETKIMSTGDIDKLKEMTEEYWESTNVQGYSYIENFESLEVSGQMDTEDTPWGKTICKANDEQNGEFLFMQPNTAISYTLEVSEECILKGTGKIHPAVSSLSDGVNVFVNVYDTNNENRKREKLFIPPEGTSIELDLSEFKGQTMRIEVACDVGDNTDGNGDWLIWSALELVGGNTYVKSAHYFSDEWPINFWNSEMDNAEAELAQIKADGFDSIILVIPWREFQPTTDPVSYNEYAFQKLSDVMELAKAAELDVVVRVGYTWDYYQDADDIITDRFYQITGDKMVSDAWYAYVDKIYDTISGYSNFKGAFLTWEDFWNNLNVCSAGLSEQESIQTASFMGYQDFVKKHYTLESFNETYGTSYTSFSDIRIPTLKEPDMYAFYEYYDDFLNQILLNSQKVFPNLSMEVRIDGDVTYSKTNELVYYYHDSTYACGDSDMTTVMYGIPMGFENKGERVTAKEAMVKTDYILSKLLRENGQKNIYVDQFIYADNTPKFKDNAQIKPEELGEYLTSVYRTLKRYTWGYGVWTYRNYCANMFYNPQFALDVDGWNIVGDASVEKVENSNMLKLKAGSAIAQKIPEVRNQFPAEQYILEFDIQIEEACQVKLQVGEAVKEVTIPESGNYYLEFTPGDNFDFSFLSEKDCTLDNMKLYSQVQEGLLYDDQGFELEQISNLRTLNEKLAR